MTLHFPARTLLLLALCVASCSRTAQPLPQGQAVLRLQAPASTQVSKTWVDAAAAGTTAPVYWSAGDRITVNGVTSSPLELAPGEKAASASFYLRNITPPFKVVYPYSAYAGADDEGSLLLDIPATQAWKDGSFAEGSALLYGYSDSEEAPVQMQNLCGAIAFTLRDPSGIKVKTLSITSRTEGKPLAGRFSLTPAESLLLTPAGNNSARVDMQFPDGGLAITPEGTSFFFTLPAGAYPDGFVIRLEDENKHILRCWWLRPSQGAEAGVTVDAGKLVVFQAQDYDPDAREICSAEDWEEFAAAYNAGGDGWKAEWLGKDGSVKIGANITAANLTSLEALSDVLDGCGYTVTVTAGTAPLVETLTGTIRNLTVAGAITLPEQADDIIAAAFVGTLHAGCVENCVNEADITVTCNINDASRQLTCGGIVAQVMDLTGSALISNCTNKGNVTAKAAKEIAAQKAPLMAAYGGIVGCVNDGTADQFLKVESCENQGVISTDFSPAPSNTSFRTATYAVSGVGGIVGAAMKYDGDLTFSWFRSSEWENSGFIGNQEGVYMEMKDCVSKGNVHNGFCSGMAHGDPNMEFAAGLIGVANGLKGQPIMIENCTVQDITVRALPGKYYQRAGFCMVSAGLAGFGGHVYLKDCTVKDCTIGTLLQPSYAAAGGIGMAPVTFKMEGCKVFAQIEQIRCVIANTTAAFNALTEDQKKERTTGHYAMLFSLSTKKGPEKGNSGFGGMRNSMVNPAGSSVTGCSFGGTITQNKTLVMYNASSGFETVYTTTLSDTNYKQYLTCDTFLSDYKNRGIAGMVEISDDNSYWNGQD